MGGGDLRTRSRVKMDQVGFELKGIWRNRYAKDGSGNRVICLGNPKRHYHTFVNSSGYE
jgi:hypothetical protein